MGQVLRAEPGRHLAAVPVDPFGLTAAIVMVLLRLALAAGGIAAFERLDLVGA